MNVKRNRKMTSLFWSFKNKVIPGTSIILSDVFEEHKSPVISQKS